MINVALVGYGYWGVNLLRNLTSIKNCNVAGVCESNENRHAAIKELYPDAIVVSNYSTVLSNPKIDAVVIATPVDTHYELAKQALLSGKHVLVEKPLTSSTNTAQELVELARSKDLLLMVDHTFLYSGAVEKIRELVDLGTIGKLQYLDSTRINLGLIQSDINVLWDLAPHDLSILAAVSDEKPVSVVASGVSHIGTGIENIAYMTLQYESGFIAHFNCSWSSPVKVRTMLIGGDKKMVVYDDINPTEKVKVYDSGYVCKNDEDRRKIRVDYRIGDIHVPKISTHEPLKKMLEDFIYCIQHGATPRSNAELGLQVVKILEAAQVSISNDGKKVLL